MSEVASRRGLFGAILLRTRRLGDDLVRRCQAALEDHLHSMQLCFTNLVNDNGNPVGIRTLGDPGVASHFWCVGSGWEDRETELFSLGGNSAPGETAVLLLLAKTHI